VPARHAARRRTLTSATVEACPRRVPGETVQRRVYPLRTGCRPKIVVRAAPTGLPAQDGLSAEDHRLCRPYPANEFAAMETRCRPSPTARARADTVPRRMDSVTRVAGRREWLKPCSQSASARDRAYRCPSGGFTRSGRAVGRRLSFVPRPLVYPLRTGCRPKIVVRAAPTGLPARDGLSAEDRRSCRAHGFTRSGRAVGRRSSFVPRPRVYPLRTGSPSKIVVRAVPLPGE
jgi:hypothetical protein